MQLRTNDTGEFLWCFATAVSLPAHGTVWIGGVLPKRILGPTSFNLSLLIFNSHSMSEGLSAAEIKNQPGVLESHQENNHYVVRVCWQDGQETKVHFPVNGFPVVDTKTGERLGFIKGSRAVEILTQHASEYASDEFSWRNFL